ncbi:transposase [Umezawaea sp. Da 62-37]|uniref:IS701 family transposase n=1 Tax=Umezawaea sp. Da 62-37 TaxID=3075927 RepID=UPI0028F73A09|nr:transposase [Umezawaea sp. Da 62-37]WNV85080.1 transposase [Umezawaea sp. Da 62-37]
MLEGLRGVFTAPSFTTFTSLITGLLGATGSRTVTGMWSAAGLAGRSHHARAHRFFSHARWDPDSLGLFLVRLVVARFVPAGAALQVVVDDTLFHRYGTKTHGVSWQHDGSAKGRDGLGRGNCFVVVGLVVAVPFLARAVCLPVLFRLHIPRSGVSKPDAARALVGLLARAFPERTIHVTADSAYRGPAWRTLPATITFTARLAANAVLYALPPAPTGKRGHPAWKGPRLGTCADLAATAKWREVSVTRYSKTQTVHMATIACLWWGSLHRTPVTVVLLKETDSTLPYDVAVVSTDTGACAETLVSRYADRWSVEQSIKDSKILIGAGDAANRLPLAVQRSVPFAMLGLTVLVLWYAGHGTAETDLAAARARAPWNRKKTHVSVDDMLIAFRRARITAIGAGQDTLDHYPAEAVTSGSAAA